MLTEVHARALADQVLAETMSPEVEGLRASARRRRRRVAAEGRADLHQVLPGYAAALRGKTSSGSRCVPTLTECGRAVTRVFFVALKWKRLRVNTRHVVAGAFASSQLANPKMVMHFSHL